MIMITIETSLECLDYNVNQLIPIPSPRLLTLDSEVVNHPTLI